MNTSQILAMLNQKVARAESNNALLKQQLEEVQGQYAYECECNKQFVETQNKCERLDVLLNNVCAYLVELVGNDEEFMTAEHSDICFGMTKEEHKKYIKGE